MLFIESIIQITANQEQLCKRLTNDWKEVRLLVTRDALIRLARHHQHDETAGIDRNAVTK
ncbi:hypothetical protein V6669_11010 [Paenibacillus sp. Y5S-9]|uniref:hypothetical protein n=1 Tax=Paenibacillus sp. Y5S-9 TaxID=3122489 RepID=UPI0030D3B022